MYSYSIGFKLLSFEEFPKILDQTNADDIRSSAFNGFIFKINDNQISYRLSGNFYSKRMSFSNGCTECEILGGRLNDNHIKLGFEKNFSYGLFQPYFGFDLGVKRSVFKGVSSGLIADDSRMPYDIKSEKNGFTVSPLLGIKVTASHLTIAAEASADVFYNRERQEKSYHATPGTSNVQKSNNWEYLLKPLGMLTIQYNFGEIY